jgi:hypothetical protein
MVGFKIHRPPELHFSMEKENSKSGVLITNFARW